MNRNLCPLSVFLLSALATLAPAATVSTQPASTASAAAQQDTDNPILHRLQAAKGIYDQETDSAKKRLDAFFQSRADAAQKQGDLAALKTDTDLKTAFDNGSVLPDDAPDAATRNNISTYLFFQRVATKNLQNAYAAAVRDCTKASMIAEAEALQTESDAFQKSAIALAPSSPTGVPAANSASPAAALENGRPFTFGKASGLPKLFEANPDLRLSDNGLTFPSLTYLRSARTDFNAIDFSLDVIVDVKAKEQLKIGIGAAMPGKPAFAGIALMQNGMALDEAVGELGKVGRANTSSISKSTARNSPPPSSLITKATSRRISKKPAVCEP